MTSVALYFSPVFSFLTGLITRLVQVTQPNNNQHATTSMEGPRDCVLVIDASPSMETSDWKPSRLAGAMEAAQAFIKRLKSTEPDSRVAIVSYGEMAQVMCDLTPVTETAKLNKSIRGIRTSWSTNITAGLKTAGQILKHHARDCQIVLLSDGYHNNGPRPTATADYLKKFSIIDCVGIGGRPKDVDEKLLKKIATVDSDGTRHYRWIGDKQRLVRHFEKLASGISRK